jgi:hypothetical protein
MFVPKKNLRLFLLIAAVVFLMPAIALAERKKDFNFSGYNILFVSFDALQAAHAGCLGYFRNTTLK